MSVCNQVELRVRVECGATTCASSPGKFCKYVGARKMGTVSICLLFPSIDTSFTDLEDDDGWLQRCPDCISAEF